MAKEYKPITEAQSIKNLEQHLEKRKAYCLKRLQYFASEYVSSCKALRTECSRKDYDDTDNMIISLYRELDKLLNSGEK